MAKNELSVEDSPFYIDYKEKSVDKSFKMPKDMLKALEKHLQDKHADEVKTDSGNKFRFGKYIRKTLEDYLQHQCLERKMFGKSIFAIYSEDKLNEDNDPIVDACFVTNPSVHYSTKKLDEVAPLFYQVHKVALDDFHHDLMLWGAKLENSFLLKLKEYQDAYSSENIQVLEIPLNNYLDFYHDGIYSDRSHSNVHIGANIIATNDGYFGIVYHWVVDYDYSIKITFVQMCNQELLLHWLRQCGNEDVYFEFLKIFQDKNNFYPQMELDLLQKKLETKMNVKRDIEDEIADLQKQIDEVKNKNS